MNTIKKIYSKIILKRKILKIKSEMKKIITSLCKENFWIDWYGAYEINPKNLVYWICVESDNKKNLLKSNIELQKDLKDLLAKQNYPCDAIKYVQINIESQETVDRESGGSWYYHFK
jgi:hypothetical protein